MANNTSRKKSSNSTSPKRREVQKKDGNVIKNDIVVILIIAVSALLFIGNLGFGGIVGDTVSGVFFGLFGLINYILPVYISLTAVFYFAKRNEKDTRLRVVFFVLLIFLVSLLCALFRDGSETLGPELSYTLGKDSHIGGGFFGGALAEFFCTIFGLAGSYVIDVLLIILSLVIISGFSLSDYLKDFFNDLKEDRERKKELNAEDRRLRKEERKKEKEALREARLERERERDKEQRERKLEEKKRKEEEEESPIHVLDFENHKKASRANSNIHPGRPVRDIKSEAEKSVSGAVNTANTVNALNTTESESDQDIVILPRRERAVSGMTFDTEIAPISMDMPAKSDEMNEVTADDIQKMSEAARYDKELREKDELENRSESMFDEVTVNNVTLHSVDEKPESLFITKPEPAPEERVIETPAPVQEDINSLYREETVEETPSDDSLDMTEIKPVNITETKPENKPVVSAPENVSEIKANPPATAESPEENRPYVFPDISLLNEGKNKGKESGGQSMQKTADKLELILKNFGINASVTGYSHGPSVTRYELLPEMGVKVSKILNLTDDIKMNLAATDIRIEAPIPGKNAIGIEVPNKEREAVVLRELVSSKEFKNNKSKIAFGLGLDIAGKVIISDIAKMPHLLIAGATGSGKSVCINTIIMSILYRATPDEVKFIMIDPKVVELSVYNGIPHLLIPVVTDPKKASGALQWAVKEMMDRYQKFADCHVRDMEGYNAKIIGGRMKITNNGNEIEIAAKKMPQLVIVVDELADLMMVASKEVEESICRLAQLARAAGIHLVIATQRPSVNVITGLIKANMPSRIALSVTSGVDSRTIIDTVGAERLLGHGDMLYYPQDMSKPVRLQGAYVADDEVSRVASFLRENNRPTAFDSEENRRIQEDVDRSAASSDEGYTSIDGEEGGFGKEKDEFFNEAARLFIEKDKGSIGMLQRNFRIGFNRAARIVDQLEEFGVVGPEEGTKPRRILVTMDEFEQMISD